MPSVNKTPTTLKTYASHGVDLTESSDGRQATGECPWCGKPGKFSVNVETGIWKCWSCQTGTDRGGGNARTFVQLLFDRASAADEDLLAGLAESRSLLTTSGLAEWGVVQSPLTREWVVPGYDADGRVCQAYRYTNGVGGKKVLAGTASLPVGLFGPSALSGLKAASTVYVCEGPWDGVALWEVLVRTKDVNGRLTVTGSRSASLAKDSVVVAVPGAGSFRDEWAEAFAGKKVVLMYDSDHPRTNAGKKTVGAGPAGARRTAGVLGSSPTPPAVVRRVEWGPDGYDPDLPSGFDVRDALVNGLANAAASATLTDRIRNLQDLLGLVREVPREWTEEAPRRPGLPSKNLDLIPCSSWKELTDAWRAAMFWTDGLDVALSVVLAAVASTPAVGDQLWVKLIAPPSSGKSVLCEAVSTAKKYVFANSTMTGLHSGWKTDAKGQEDHSMIAKIAGRTLVIKDGDTLLQSPQRDKILSELRDLYDRVSRVHYGHGVRREYEDVPTTVILAGTSSLRSLDTSELGERFLDVVIVSDMDESLERDIGWMVAQRAFRQAGTIANCSPQSQASPEMVRAKQLTGGFVEHLRTDSHDVLGSVVIDDEALRRCQYLGELVAFMRSRPSAKQDEGAEREMSFRLISQMVRLARCLAAVVGERTVTADGEVMRRVRKVALDTARGRVLDICHVLAEAGDGGAEVRAISARVAIDEDKVKAFLKHLRSIRAVEMFRPSVNKTIGGLRWKLSRRLSDVYRLTIGSES